MVVKETFRGQEILIRYSFRKGFRHQIGGFGINARAHELRLVAADPFLIAVACQFVLQRFFSLCTVRFGSFRFGLLFTPRQLGLFDEWEQNTEATAQSILKNLESQITGMQNYNDNMAKLTKAAVESNDPNFKAFVQAVSEMGVGAAGEVQALVTAMETDQTTFNEIVQGFDTMGTLKEEYAK